MSEFDSLVEQMKLCDQQWQQILSLKTSEPKTKATEEANELSRDILSVVKREPNVNEVIKNEELIELYFNRFLVSDRNKEKNVNRFYIKAKENCKQMSEQLFETITKIDTNCTLDVDISAQCLAKTCEEIKAKTLKSMAENDIRIFESKQMANKLGINWISSEDTEENKS